MASRSVFAVVVAAGVFAGCAGVDEEADPLAELDDDAEAGKADGWGTHGPIEVTPGMSWLSQRSEAELARLFSRGSATAIPAGEARQNPLVGVFGSPGLLPIVQELFQGTVWVHAGNGGVTVYSKFIPRLGGVTAPYSGVASHSTIAQLDPASGARPPSGTSYPHYLSPYWNGIGFDDRPSVFVDYQADPTPIIGRSIDEFREIDPTGCPGLYLVRTHYLQSATFNRWVYLFYIAADFGPSDRACDLARLL